MRSFLERFKPLIDQADFVLLEQQRPNSENKFLLALTLQLQLIEFAIRISVPEHKLVIMYPATVKTAYGLCMGTNAKNKVAVHEHVKNWEIDEEFWKDIETDRRHHVSDCLVQTRYFLETQFSKQIIIEFRKQNGTQTSKKRTHAEPDETATKADPPRRNSPRKRRKSKHSPCG